MVSADGAATTAFAVYDRQARRAMLVEFLARFFNRRIRAATWLGHYLRLEACDSRPRHGSPRVIVELPPAVDPKFFR